MANIFELNINLNTTGKSEAEKALSETETGSLIEPTSGDTKSPASSGKAAAGAVALLAINEAKKVAGKIVSYEINKIGTIYGDQARQNEINNMMSTAGTIMGIGTTTASFAVAGSVAGPVGTAVGAVIGAIVGTVGEVVNMVQRVEMFNVEQRDHMLNSNYAAERLGILTSSKGR